jgi:hypothetical protein
VEKLLIKKCEINSVAYRPDLLFDAERLRGVRSHWTPGLGYLTKNLPEFDGVLSDLRGMLSFLLE